MAFPSRGWLGGLGATLAALAIALLAGCAGHTVDPPPRHYAQAEFLREEPGPANPVLARVNAAELKGAWAPAPLPHVARVLDTGGAARGGWSTTWLRVALDPAAAKGPQHLYMIRWLAAGQLALYADGALIYRSTGTPTWNLFSHPALVLPLSRGADGALPRELLIRLDSISTRVAGVSSFYIGPPAAIVSMAAAREWLARQLPFMSAAAFFAVGLFALVAWCFRRRDPAYLLIFAVALMLMVRRWHFHIGLERIDVPDTWFLWLTFIGGLWQHTAMYFFLRCLHGRKLPWTDRGVFGFALLFSALTFAVAMQIYPVALQARLYIQLASIAAVATFGLIATWQSLRSRLFDPLLLSGVFLLNVAALIYDWAKLGFWIDVEAYHMTPFGTVLLFAAFAVILFRRYTGAFDDAARANANLESRLREREAALEETHTRLRDAERRETLAEERRRMTQDMHDGLGSSLVSALRVVQEGRMDANQLEDVLQGCIDDLRLTIDSIEPVDADPLLLLATLRHRLGSRLTGAGIALRWEVSPLPRLEWLDARTSLHVLRIMQEAIANILKHTHASEVRVGTGVDEHRVWISIADNGGGFDATANAGRGLGLANQQRRARSIGGEVAVTSSAAGTKVTLYLPLRKTTELKELP